MTSDVVLTSAMRNNLLSLQHTQSLIDSTQNILSTGKKVNSALDNPQSFFQSQSLSNRAGDLTKLLDGIGQSIEVIKAANNGVTALTSLINQAQAVAQSAQSTVSGGASTAGATGNVTLTNSTVLTSLAGVTNGSILNLTVTDPNGGTSPITGGTGNNGAITISTGETVSQLVDAINAINANGNSGAALTTPAIKASLDSSGHLQLQAINGGNLNVGFAAAGATTATNQTFATGLGFGGIARTDAVGSASGSNLTVDFTALASSSLTSNALYASGGGVAQATTKLTSLYAADGTTSVSTFGAGASLKITVNGKQSAELTTYAGLAANTQTIAGLVDAINHDANIGDLVTASFDSTTGKINIAAKDSSVNDIQFNVANAASSPTQTKLDIFQGSNIDAGAATASYVGNVDFRLGSAAGSLANLQSQYNGLLDQMDSLVTNGDTAYQGTNLLNGDNLVTTFNETRTSTLTTNGTKFNSTGLGLSDANFNTADSINATIDKLNTALTQVRNFGSNLASDLSVIQTRQTFTNSTISTLQEGSDNLVNADQNSESATLLALQTRQSLGVSALSLANQSAQSVLRLFQ